MNEAILNRFTGVVIVEAGKYATVREAAEKNYSNLSYSNLSSSDLRYSDLRYSNLSYSDLSYSNLSYSDLRYIKNYSHSHDIFQELVKREKTDKFTLAQWGMIGQILVHRLCWDSIEKRYGKKMLKVFAVLTKSGFGEFEEKYKEVLKNA